MKKPTKKLYQNCPLNIRGEPGEEPADISDLKDSIKKGYAKDKPIEIYSCKKCKEYDLSFDQDKVCDVGDDMYGILDGKERFRASLDEEKREIPCIDRSNLTPSKAQTKVLRQEAGKTKPTKYQMMLQYYKAVRNRAEEKECSIQDAMNGIVRETQRTYSTLKDYWIIFENVNYDTRQLMREDEYRDFRDYLVKKYGNRIGVRKDKTLNKNDALLIGTILKDELDYQQFFSAMVLMKKKSYHMGKEKKKEFLKLVKEREPNTKDEVENIWEKVNVKKEKEKCKRFHFKIIGGIDKIAEEAVTKDIFILPFLRYVIELALGLMQLPKEKIEKILKGWEDYINDSEEIEEVEVQ